MNKTLLQILVDELPKRGGWPNGVDKIVQDDDGKLYGRDFYTKGDLFNCDGEWAGCYAVYGLTSDESCSRATDQATAVVTKEQYEQAVKDLS